MITRSGIPVECGVNTAYRESRERVTGNDVKRAQMHLTLQVTQDHKWSRNDTSRTLLSGIFHFSFNQNFSREEKRDYEILDRII